MSENAYERGTISLFYSWCVAMKKNIVVLISGRGSNFKSVYEASVRENWAEKYGLYISVGIPSKVVDHKGYESRGAFEKDLADACDEFGADLIVLAGFMRVLTPYFVDRFSGRILNIHPALLPLFTGLHTHERALQAGVRVHGVTVHFVSAELDGGPIVGQAAVPVLANDTPEILAARVLVQEHVLYPRAVRLVASGRVKLDGNKVLMDEEASRELAILAQ